MIRSVLHSSPQKSHFKTMLALLLVISVFFTGCTGSSKKDPNESSSTSSSSSTASLDESSKEESSKEESSKEESSKEESSKEESSKEESSGTKDPEKVSSTSSGAAGRFMDHDYSKGEKPTDPEKIDCGAKLIAMTFDDGPNDDTMDFINQLNELDVNCTFFMLGSNAQYYPKTLEAMVKGGHQIANHSYDHPNLQNLDDDSAYAQIMDTEAILKDIDGKDGHYIRCPYGNSTDYVSSFAPAPLIYWSLDTEDWSSRDADSVYDTIMEYAYDGAIVLCHDIYESSREGALRSIRSLKEQGYEFVTVEELFKRRGVSISNGETYYDATNEGVNLPADSVHLAFGSFSKDKQPTSPESQEPAA